MEQLSNFIVGALVLSVIATPIVIIWIGTKLESRDEVMRAMLRDIKWAIIDKKEGLL